MRSVFDNRGGRYKPRIARLLNLCFLPRSPTSPLGAGSQMAYPHYFSPPYFSRLSPPGSSVVFDWRVLALESRSLWQPEEEREEHRLGRHDY